MKHGELRTALIKIAFYARQRNMIFPRHSAIAATIGCSAGSISTAMLSLSADRVVRLDGRIVVEVRV